MKKKILKVFAITIFTASLFSCGTNHNTTSASSSLEETTSENSSSTENYECISVERAIELAREAGENGTSESYYVRGTIKTVSNPTYGQMIITDGTNELSVYGTYSSDGSLRYSELEDKPVAGDEVVLYGQLKTYKDSPEMGKGYIMEFVHNTPDVDINDYQAVSVLEARNKEEGTKVKLSGVVASITYANGLIPNGLYLVDNTSSIYVYGGDVAGQVKVGNTITIAGEKDYYVLETEQANAVKFNYKGANQISKPVLLKNDNQVSSWDKSWVEEIYVKSVMETPVSNDITTKIFKTTALIKKVEGSGFTNYYIDDLDGKTGSYAYSQANGTDFSWLDKFDGKICTVYFAAHNAKAGAASCVYRFVPIEVIDENYQFDLAYSCDYALRFFGKDQFETEYSNDPALKLISNVSSELLGIDNVELSFTSSNTDALEFVVEEGVVTMHTKEVSVKTDVEVTIKATYESSSVVHKITISVLPEQKIEGMSIQEAISATDGTEITVKGIVLSSLVNQSGFYIIDETGVIAVRTKDEGTDKTVKPGDLVSVKGTKKHIKPTEKCVGQIAIDSAEVLVNAYGENQIPTSVYKQGKTITALYNLDPLEDHTTEVFKVKAKISFIDKGNYTTAVLVDPNDESVSLGLYTTSASQYNFLKDYEGQVLTYNVAVCNWNGKNYYRGCIVSVETSEGTT
ncbi:MAG: hypothetical protein MR674_00620, partial [Erysipelotrichaceae bacterium]|nr:hypothetical protein [Erysipelotrichaceae bacterium]